MGNVKKAELHPIIVSGIILAVSQIFTLFLAFREKVFLASSQIIPPEVSVKLPLIYFFVAVGLIGLILFLIPQKALKMVLKILFLSLFAWGIFIALVFYSPLAAAVAASVVATALYFFIPRIWLHNLMMVIALASMGTVFGVLFTPWTVIVIMLAISVYDIIAVRFGYMMWMVKKLSISDTLPAFVIPKTISGWNLDLRKTKILEDKTEREFSILGGGDIGFPLLLIVAVFFAYGFTSSLIVAGFTLLGLAAAYWVQRKLLKGKPTPALPPITVLSIAGFLIVYLA